jgi:hypothetical protein
MEIAGGRQCCWPTRKGPKGRVIDGSVSVYLPHSVEHVSFQNISIQLKFFQLNPVLPDDNHGIKYPTQVQANSLSRLTLDSVSEALESTRTHQYSSQQTGSVLPMASPLSSLLWHPLQLQPTQTIVFDLRRAQTMHPVKNSHWYRDSLCNGVN